VATARRVAAKQGAVNLIGGIHRLPGRGLSASPIAIRPRGSILVRVPTQGGSTVGDRAGCVRSRRKVEGRAGGRRRYGGRSRVSGAECPRLVACCSRHAETRTRQASTKSCVEHPIASGIRVEPRVKLHWRVRARRGRGLGPLLGSWSSRRPAQEPSTIGTGRMPCGIMDQLRRSQAGPRPRADHRLSIARARLICGSTTRSASSVLTSGNFTARSRPARRAAGAPLRQRQTRGLGAAISLT